MKSPASQVRGRRGATEQEQRHNML